MPTLPDLGTHAPAYILLALAIVAVLAIARRIPVLGTLVSLASWLLAIGLLAVALNQHGRFDPYFARFTQALNIDDQQVAGTGEVRIRMAADGHFWARVTLDGAPRRMLIDSGATVTALSAHTAAAAGLAPRDGLVPVLLTTANGTIRAQSATVGELRLGSIVARDLAVVVSPAFGNTDVIGMNLLSRLASWRVEGGTLILVPHHPQGVARTPHPPKT